MKFTQTDKLEQYLDTLSSREYRLYHLRKDLNDRRRKKANAYARHTENLEAWIAYIEAMTDAEYEADRLLWTTGDFAENVVKMQHPIDMAGRDCSPAYAVRELDELKARREREENRRRFAY